MLRRFLTLLALAVLVLTGCANPVGVPTGPHASAPACGQVLMASPDSLRGLERRSTTSQATTAWGDPAVTLRCGVEVPGPTTDRCVSVETNDGASVDWVSYQEEQPGADGGSWTFVTYGRDPAVEVVIPVAQVGTGQATAFLTELGSAVRVVEAGRACVGPDDLG
ncbi:DUF3515 domain-containing protein [Georgenia deserti]|uniref:DUF3515 domain-containing protein n=1 Tax=Georgenia deserti TaxID=2093781 RepID=A0ABW4L3Q1_9MICO